MKAVKPNFLLFSCLFFCLSAPNCFAEKFVVHVTGLGNLPYNSNSKQVNLQTNPLPGLSVEICLAIGRITQDQFHFVSYPVVRGLKEFDRGFIDLEPGVNPNWRANVKVKGQFSIAYAESVNVVVFPPGKRRSVNGPKDLYGETVGTTRGFSYPRFDDAFKSGAIIRADNLSQTSLVAQLYSGRLNQIFVGLNTLKHLQRGQPKLKELVIGDVIDSQELMIRVHPDKAGFIPRLNAALRLLVKRGEIDRIYARYR